MYYVQEDVLELNINRETEEQYWYGS